MAKTPDSSHAHTDKNAQPAFEALLKELDETVKKMESGHLSLEESLHCFEKGIALTRQCQAILDKAEKRIEALMQDLPNEE